MNLPNNRLSKSEIEKILAESDFDKLQSEQRRLAEKIINDEKLEGQQLIDIYLSTKSSSIHQLVMEHPKCPLNLVEKIAETGVPLEKAFANAILRARAND